MKIVLLKIVISGKIVYCMYQILQKFDIHWYGGGSLLAMEGSPICSMIEKVVYYVIWKMLYYIVPYSLSKTK